MNIYLREKSMLSVDALLNKAEQEKLRDKIRRISAKGFIYDFIERLGVSNDNIFRVIADLALKAPAASTARSCSMTGRRASSCPSSRAASTASPGRHTVLWPKKLLREVVEKKDGVLFNVSDPDGAASILCAPLTIRNNVFGILSLWKNRNGACFTDQDLHVILSLARRASLNLENKVLYETLYTNIAETFRALVTSIQARDQYTDARLRERHGFRRPDRGDHGVLARRHRVPQDRRHAPRHRQDRNPGPHPPQARELTGEEYAIIKTHCTIGDDILTPIALFEKERKIIRHHHENWDGTGYPDGLAGDQIPLLSRMISVADAYDAMTTNRPYRASMSPDEAITELRRFGGTQFDPKVVDAFIGSLQPPYPCRLPVIVNRPAE